MLRAASARRAGGVDRLRGSGGGRCGRCFVVYATTTTTGNYPYQYVIMGNDWRACVRVYTATDTIIITFYAERARRRRRRPCLYRGSSATTAARFSFPFFFFYRRLSHTRAYGFSPNNEPCARVFRPRDGPLKLVSLLYVLYSDR